MKVRAFDREIGTSPEKVASFDREIGSAPREIATSQRKIATFDREIPTSRGEVCTRPRGRLGAAGEVSQGHFVEIDARSSIFQTNDFAYVSASRGRAGPLRGALHGEVSQTPN